MAVSTREQELRPPDRAAPSVKAEKSPDIELGQKRGWRRYEATVIGTGSVVLFLLVWQGIALVRLVPELFLPGPLDTINALINLFRGGTIWRDLWVSGQELIEGYGL